MKTISIKPDTPMKRYLTVASVLLLLFTAAIPPLGVSFVAANVIFFALRVFLKKRGTGENSFRRRILLGTVLCNIFLLLYTCFTEAPVADDSAYAVTVRYGRLMQENMVSFLKILYTGVQTREGILFPAVVIAPVLQLFGESFPVFVLLAFNLFFVPLGIVLGLLLHGLCPKHVPLVFLFTPFSVPFLKGNLNGAGLVWISLWFLLIYKKAFRKKNIKEAIALGAVSVLPVLTRPWYLLSVIGIFAAFLLSLGIRRLYDKKYSTKEMLTNLGTAGAVFICLTFLFMFPHLKTALSGLVTADAGLYLQNAGRLFRSFGALPLLFSLLGLGGLWRRHFRQFTIFLLCYLGIVFLLVAGSTPFSDGQQYLFAPGLFLLAVIGVFSLPKLKKTALAVLYVVCGIGILCVCFPVLSDFLRGFFSV